MYLIISHPEAICHSDKRRMNGLFLSNPGVLKLREQKIRHFPSPQKFAQGNFQLDYSNLASISRLCNEVCNKSALPIIHKTSWGVAFTVLEQNLIGKFSACAKKVTIILPSGQKTKGELSVV